MSESFHEQMETLKGVRERVVKTKKQGPPAPEPHTSYEEVREAFKGPREPIPPHWREEE